MPINWTGVFPALTTKFTAADELDLPLFEKNLQVQLSAGLTGSFWVAHWEKQVC
jgi:dihydrodipicolinate synthase/N-acetylneuraminate lyase